MGKYDSWNLYHRSLLRTLNDLVETQQAISQTLENVVRTGRNIASEIASLRAEVERLEKSTGKAAQAYGNEKVY